MKKADMKVYEDGWAINIDILKEFDESKSEKSIAIAAAEGNFSVLTNVYGSELFSEIFRVMNEKETLKYGEYQPKQLKLGVRERMEKEI
jgi:hypothetical protein